MNEWVAVDDGKRAIHLTNIEWVRVHDDTHPLAKRAGLGPIWAVTVLDASSHVSHYVNETFETEADAEHFAQELRKYI